MTEEIYEQIWKFTTSHATKDTSDVDIYNQLVVNGIIHSSSDTVFQRDVFECINSAIRYGQTLADKK